MAQNDDYDFDLQPADDIGCGDLDIVIRSLDFAASSNGQSPSLVIIAAEDNVCFRVLYGWSHDDFDDVFSTDLIGRMCRVSGVGPRYLTDFSAWLRDTSGATENSSVSRLPRPICQSAREMWESLCGLKRKFAADAFILGKEIRRRVEAWEVVNADLDDFFMDTEPSEEDKVSVFGPTGLASEEPTNPQNVGISGSSNGSPPPPPPPSSSSSSAMTPSIAALVLSSSSLNAEAPVFESASSSSSSSPNIATNSDIPVDLVVPTPRLSCKQRRKARDELFHANIAKKIRDRRARRAVREEMSPTSASSSSSSSASPTTSSASVSRDVSKFKKPFPPAQKSVVVVPESPNNSSVRSATSSVSGSRKRERSASSSASQHQSFPSPRPAASVQDQLCEIIEAGLRQDAASPHPHARKRAADRMREREEALTTGVVTSYFADAPSSTPLESGRTPERPTSSSSRTSVLPSSSSSRSNSSSKSSSKIEYESRRSLRRQHEELGRIMSLLDLPRSIVPSRVVEELMDNATRVHAESRVRSRSPLSESRVRSRSPLSSSKSSSSSSSSRNSRSPNRASSSRRRSPSPSTSRSTSVKDRLGAKASEAGEGVAPATRTSSSYSPMFSADNPPPQSVYRCNDIRLSSGEVGGYTERADEPRRSSEASSGKGKGSGKNRKGKGHGKESGGWKK